MQPYDRLTALTKRFHLSVTPAPMKGSNLIVVTDQKGQPSKILLRTRMPGFEQSAEPVVLAAHVDWGGAANPLMAALPDLVQLDFAQDAETAGLVALLRSEMTSQRCGVGSVVNRLCEVLFIRFLRSMIAQGTTRPGLLAGLSDPRLSRAIAAIHDEPGRNWRNEDLAQIAGMSLSRFAEIFLARVGEPPATYIRRWRLTLARQDIEKRDRVDAIARRYGYASPEAFARAFKKHYGEKPISQRPAF